MSNFSIKVGLALFSLFAILGNLEGKATTNKILPQKNQLTFSYTQEELNLFKLMPKSETHITDQELYKLTDEVEYLMKSTDLSGINQTILLPYLANAQKDFAWLSYLTTNELSGDLGPITQWVVQLFIPNAELPSVKESCYDVYSSTIAAVVLGKVAKRLEEERKGIANYSVKKGKDLWTPTSPGYTGLNYGSAKTWYLSSSDELVADKPEKNASYWDEQCQNIQKEQNDLNHDKTYAVFEWAGMTSLKAGRWEDILFKYLKEKQTPVIAQLYIRAVFLSALADSNAASFNSKYTYWVMRPSQYDPKVNPLIKIPNHPSYPSAHSTISATAATVLTEFFPQNKKQWWSLAEESGMSRIWGGIHYPVDHQGGKKLGTEVGNTALKKSFLKS